ncbi:hypothetical protein LCGC14_2062420 [marine sediment metagenome]|uniref:Uncharacterized protein n=1 Tax=marine sediment metagenome TaxID=412755 RepID=A0A0F9GZ97_9ZZZZ
MTLILGISLITSLLTVVMMWQLARKRKSGLYVSLIAQPFWAYFNFLSEAWGFYILTVVMTFIALRGIVKWRDEVSDDKLDDEAVGTLMWVRERLEAVLEQTENVQYVNLARSKFLAWVVKIDDTLDR